MIIIYSVAAFWFFSALLSTIIANRLKISMALMEIIIGAIIGYFAFKLESTERLSLNADWMKFLAGVAAILLTFLAGSELNPDSLKSKFNEITIIGLVGFFAPFIGASLVGLTFDTISALYGLTNNIITQEQYSFLVGTVIASAIIPTLIANKFFLPKHLLEEPLLDDQPREIPLKIK